MIYRESGQFRTTYDQDIQIFPLRQDRVAMIALLVVAIGVIPFVASDYWLKALLIPWLIFSLVAL